jgi:hypothetical protein
VNGAGVTRYRFIAFVLSFGVRQADRIAKHYRSTEIRDAWSQSSAISILVRTRISDGGDKQNGVSMRGAVLTECRSLWLKLQN